MSGVANVTLSFHTKACASCGRPTYLGGCKPQLIRYHVSRADARLCAAGEQP